MLIATGNDVSKQNETKVWFRHLYAIQPGNRPVLQLLGPARGTK